MVTNSYGDKTTKIKPVKELIIPPEREEILNKLRQVL